MPGTTNDPLHFLDVGLRLGGEPSPLRDARIAVRLEGGLATVATSRYFANAGPHPIEAVLTWPVPTAAVVHGLAVRIGDRVLRGEALDRAAARDAYEAALDDDRMGVLHEEVLKGVHVLSIGQVPPGAAVEVGTLWTTPLAPRGGEAELHIPATVGEIYGRDPLPPSDALVADGPPATARIAVFGGRDLRLNGAPLREGAEALAALDLPIVVRCRADAAPARGRDPDGRGVTVTVTPSAGRRALDLRVLIDCSGSTVGPFDPTGTGRSVWDVSGLALKAALGGLDVDDDVTLWDFNSRVRRIGSARGPEAAHLVALRRPPAGGTEIGAAIATAGIGDVLVVTDGRSYAIDPLAVAASGTRLSALLMGAHSLDEALGHAVALTGGSMALVGDEGEGPAEATAALASLLADLRGLSAEPEASGLAALPERLTAIRGGARIAVAWDAAPPDGGEDPRWLDGTALARAGLGVDPVAAYAAGLALPRLAEAEARCIAVAHGLATHLTNLLMFDRADGVQDGMPEQHEVAPPRSQGDMACISASTIPLYMRAVYDPIDFDAVAQERAGLASTSTALLRREIVAVACGIHWSRQGAALSRGDLSSLGAEHQATVRQAAALPEVAAAVRPGEDAVVIVVALMARCYGQGRAAELVAARLKRIVIEDRLAAVEEVLGLD